MSSQPQSNGRVRKRKRPLRGGTGNRPVPATAPPPAAPDGTWQAESAALRIQYRDATRQAAASESSACYAWATVALEHLEIVLAAQPEGQGEFRANRALSTRLLAKASSRPATSIGVDYRIGRLIRAIPDLVDMFGARQCRKLAALVDWEGGQYTIDANIEASVRELAGQPPEERNDKAVTALLDQYGRGRKKRASAASAAGSATEEKQVGEKKPAEMQAAHLSEVLAMSDRPAVALGKLLGATDERIVRAALSIAMEEVAEPLALIQGVIDSLATLVLVATDDAQPGSEPVAALQLWEVWEKAARHFSRLSREEVEPVICTVCPSIADRLAERRRPKEAQPQPVGA